ncbi:hypothetical protein AN700_0229115 [Klebsiella michiganensis]|nr:hypothetical protein [Salmonella enterica subsp. enterica serovar Java]OEG92726.1 hypothetical protein AN700_0229115 [Klebsiella michiganensis]
MKSIKVCICIILFIIINVLAFNNWNSTENYVALFNVAVLISDIFITLCVVVFVLDFVFDFFRKNLSDK